MTRTVVSRDMKNFYRGLLAKDGYVVEFLGKTYRDELDSLDMLLNDYEGYEIADLKQGNGRKNQLIFLLIDKD